MFSDMTGRSGAGSSSAFPRPFQRTLNDVARHSESYPRRQFLAALSSVPLLAQAASAEPGPAKSAGIIDTHTHFYDPTRPQGVPWPPPDDPVLYRSVLPDEFRRLVQPLGVTGTVVVEASAWIEDNEWVLDLAAREPFLLGLVGHLQPGRPEFISQLERFRANPRFRGIRTGLWGVSLAADDQAFLSDLRRLGEHQLVLDVLVGPDRLETVASLAAKLPELRIVIDHCANVRIDGKSPPEMWLTGLRAVGRHPNVYVKVSGLVEGTGLTNGQAPRDPEFYRKILDAIYETFGQGHVLYGSNWPVSNRFASYTTVLGIVSDYFESKGREAALDYFRRNAARVYLP
jgi:L-fuconolactonase